jgi:hypothetical protein
MVSGIACRELHSSSARDSGFGTFMGLSIRSAHEPSEGYGMVASASPRPTRVTVLAVDLGSKLLVHLTIRQPT